MSRAGRRVRARERQRDGEKQARGRILQGDTHLAFAPILALPAGGAGPRAPLWDMYRGGRGWRGGGVGILGRGHALWIVGVRLAVRGEGGSATTLLRLMVKSVGGCCWRLGHGLVQERTEAGTECLSLGDGRALSWAHSYYFRFPIDAFQSSHIQSPSWELVHSLTPRYGILSYKEHHLTPLGRPPSSLPTTHAPISRYPPMFSIWSSPRQRR